jgi:hypothetical protein
MKKKRMSKRRKPWDEDRGGMPDDIDAYPPSANHGGAREGSGRKSLGRKPYLIRMKPEAMAAIQREQRKKKLSAVGEVLEMQYLQNNRKSS